MPLVATRRIAAALGRLPGIAAVLWLALAPAPAARAEPVAVDMALVLAIDASGSVDRETHALQRRGHIAALTHPAILAAIRNGGHGRIAVAYLEWASAGRHRVVVPMTVIDGAASAAAFAARVEAAWHVKAGYTATGDALRHAARLFAPARFATNRRVIDISANGLPNQGEAAGAVRDALVAAGITINGLPILAGHPRETRPGLQSHFLDCVIGGPLAFSLPVLHADDYTAALMRKMVYEISGTRPPQEARIRLAAAPSC